MSKAEFHDDINVDVGGDVLGADVLRHLRRLRRTMLWQRLIHAIAAMSVLLVVGSLLETSPVVLLQQAIALGLVWFGQLWLSHKWQRLTPENFVQHLNRRFPDFEESAQLLIQDESALTTLQSLQRQRALAVYQRNLAQAEQWQANLRYRQALSVILVCSLLLAFTDQLRSLPSLILPGNLVAPADSQIADRTAAISNVSVRITPPAYTGIEPVETAQLNLELAEGSHVQWQLSLSTQAGDYALKFSDEYRVELTQGDDYLMRASATINKTDLYRIVKPGVEGEESVGDIYSLKVTLDKAPDIRVIVPDVSTLELPKNGPASFVSDVLVKDDYGVEAVEILASIAKGSGEGVKFRDQKLGFDQYTETAKGRLYQRVWDLQALGMEPGDELYFTVLATDNRQPQANTGRSSTTIVRWLEEETAGVAAEGLAIDFIPEFFKSQRQIIIDTEQLLEDENLLEVQQFKDNSYAIGVAQAQLKEKYGQYLGDEFAEGPGEQLGIMHELAETAGEEHDQHEGDHATNAAPQNGKNLNSTADILKLFGHDHGDPEIGPITKRNPVALMKRAVSEMWQAEKHLMQAEPQLALPFEYEAYKYLKLARQADRIYTKRLGFEPPPVSEDRRLSGELDEILSYRLDEPQRNYDSRSQAWNQLLLVDVYHLLSTHSSLTRFDESERELLGRLSSELTNWSQQQPGLIQHAATLEKLLIAGQLQLDECENCISDLADTVWNQLDESAAQLHQRRASWYPDEDLIQSYQQVLKENNESENRLEDIAGDGQ